MQERPLPVPANIILDFQLWPGFGKKELVITGITGFVVIILAVVAHVVFNVSEVLCVFASFGILAFCIMLVQKIENNMSVADYISVMLRYSREQQQFLYCHKCGERSVKDVKERNRR